MKTAYLAIDLGASSGRAIVGSLSGDPPQLQLHEVHRFEHFGVDTPTGPVWDLTGLWRHILAGLEAAATWCAEHDIELSSVGVDTWGVDWALVGRSGELLALPHCYRDPQNDAACEAVLERIGGFAELYRRTGIQLMAINTLFQVAARHAAEPSLFEAADRLLFLPDLFHYWLSGEMLTERSIASTSSMLAVDSGEWDVGLLDRLGLPTHILGPICEPGTQIGVVREELAAATGVPRGLKVIAPACHDTASAVAAVPATESADAANWAYLSSGTWSLLGAERQRPLATAAAQQAPFTNERGVDGTIRLLKNIAGLWLVQELRRELRQQDRDIGYAELAQAAADAEPFRTLVDPNHSDFAMPGAMGPRLRAFAQRTGQPEPNSTGELVRCCLESLALCYGQTASLLSEVVGRPIEKLHIVGGGSQNQLLNQFTANALNRPVTIGPIEATAIGNLLVQARSCGAVDGLAALRQTVARSFPVQEVQPDADLVAWDEARRRYDQIVTSS